MNSELSHSPARSQLACDASLSSENSSSACNLQSVSETLTGTLGWSASDGSCVVVGRMSTNTTWTTTRLLFGTGTSYHNIVMPICWLIAFDEGR